MGRYDLITFNFGVHDIDYANFHEEWVPLELYRNNLRKIKRTLLATGSRVLYQASTPVCYDLTVNQRILDYNAVAKVVMAEEPAVGYNDLYQTVIDRCGQPPYNSPKYPGSPNCSAANYFNVHYKDEGWELLAEASAKAIRNLLAQQLPKSQQPLIDSLAVQCPTTTGGTATSCPAGSTCMTNAFSSSGSGCCMGHGTNAVQCSDKAHCCPEGWSCSEECKLGHCFCQPPNVTVV